MFPNFWPMSQTIWDIFGRFSDRFWNAASAPGEPQGGGALPSGGGALLGRVHGLVPWGLISENWNPNMKKTWSKHDPNK